MWLIHRGKKCTEIDDEVFRRLLSFYPEENLLLRPIPAAAVERGLITLRDLINEADVLFIPWQMFLLTRAKLSRQLRNIEKNRADKLKIGTLNSRASADGPLPYRLIDRCIRVQAFAVSRGIRERNAFCGSLKGKGTLDAVSTILSCFLINREELWRKRSKESARDYLIQKLNAKKVNVAIGVSETRLVPSTENHRRLYKNISGFCLKDDHIPFIFVNASLAEVEEPLGRQIYTLVYLLALVGLGHFTLLRDWRPTQAAWRKSAGYSGKAHRIASEFLLPSSTLAPYRKSRISSDVVGMLAEKHKITPTAVVYRLWLDRFITDDERDVLMPEPYERPRTPKSFRIDNAVRRLNGHIAVSAVHSALALQAITQNQAQYILFGRIRRAIWRDYVSRANLL